jgi:hypothetical protein
MTHDSLVSNLLTGHGAVLVAVLAAYYKYGDRSASINKSLQGVDALVTKIRRQLANELGTHLEPLILSVQKQAGVSPVLDARGETYAEPPSALRESEAFKDSVQKFVDGNSEAIADYRAATDARRQWCLWARILSWCLLGGLFWQIFSTGFIFLMERCFEIAVANIYLICISTVSSLAVLSALITLPFLLHAHDKLLEIRVRYDSP